MPTCDRLSNEERVAQGRESVRGVQCWGGWVHALPFPIDA